MLGGFGITEVVICCVPTLALIGLAILVFWLIRRSSKKETSDQ